MIRNTTVTLKTINNTQTLSNGGYLMYWKLYMQLLDMISKKESIVETMRQKFSGFHGQKLERKIKRQFAWLKFGTYTWMFVWICLIKPLGQFFSRKIRIEGSYSIPIPTIFNNISLVKSTEYKIFKITIWHTTRQRITQEDIQELIK